MRRRLTSTGLATLAALTCGVAHAHAAPSIVREVPINSAAPYSPQADGTVWQTYATSGTTGVVAQLDSQDGSVIDSWNISFPGGFLPRAIGYANNRAYVAENGRIFSIAVDGPSGTTNPGLLSSDGSTNNRLTNNQIFMRVAPDGTANVALGQSNKVGILNLNNLTDRWYPQSFYGNGVSGGGSTEFSGCFVEASGAFPAPCSGFGNGGPAAGNFDYPTDMATDGANGFHVTEYSEHTVTHVAVAEPRRRGGLNPYVLTKYGSGPGSAAGQLNGPDSIRRIPDTGRLAISNPGNRRIDEFSPTGEYERSYGFGVLTGANEFETCGVGIGQCQAGIAYQTNARSYFTQLDIVDGELWAATELDNSIQVIDLEGGGSGDSIALKAKPQKVKKNKKTTLTATLSSCEDNYKALFQIKDGPGYDNFETVPTDDDCVAKTKVKITKKSVFQALAIDENEVTLATSPKVTVKLK